MRSHNTRRGLRAALAALVALACAATQAAAAGVPPIVESPCAAGGLVSPALRDAALGALRALAVDAPGHPDHGAIHASAAAGHVDRQGRAWRQVSAYPANLALLSALAVAPGPVLPLAADWLRWQARHAQPDGAAAGIVFDHWLHERAGASTACPPDLAAASCRHADAHDSTAASLLLAADAVARHGGTAVLQEPGVRAALERAARAIDRLSLGDGLTLAQPTHRIVYTMDQVEVLAARRAWARLLRRPYGDEAGAREREAEAARMATAMTERLWEAEAGRWRVSTGRAAQPQPPHWYPDTTAQLWPLLWGAGPPDRDAAAWRHALAPWQAGPGDWSRRSPDPDGFWWPAAALGARCVGDAARADAWLARAQAAWLGPGGFAPPFHVGDLAWLLWLADPVSP